MEILNKWYQVYLCITDGHENIIRMINISLHIRKLPPATGLGGGYSGVVKTEIAKICLNFNFRGWGWGWGVGYSGVGKTQSAKICLKQNSKCQDLPKFHTTYVETNKQKREERE